MGFKFQNLSGMFLIQGTAVFLNFRMLAARSLHVLWDFSCALQHC